MVRPVVYASAWIASSHFFMFMLGTALSSFLIIGAFFPFLISGRYRRVFVSIPKVNFFLLVLVLLFFLTGLAVSQFYTPMPGASSKNSEVINVLRGAVILLVVAAIARNRHQVNDFIIGYGAIATIAMGLSFYMALGEIGVVPPTYKLFGNFFGFSQHHRFSGLMHNPNYWSIAVLTALPFLNLLYSGTIQKRIFFLILLSMAGTQLFITNSRMGMGGFAIYLLILAVANVKLRNLIMIVGVLAIGSLIYVVQPFPGWVTHPAAVHLEQSFVNEFNHLSSGGLQEESRFQRFFVGWDMATEKRLGLVSGIGIRTVPAFHNTFISSWLEYSIFAFLAYSLFLFKVFTKAIAWSKDPIATLFVLPQTIMLAWLSATNDIIGSRSFWIVLSLLASWSFFREARKYSSRHQERP